MNRLTGVNFYYSSSAASGAGKINHRQFQWAFLGLLNVALSSITPALAQQCSQISLNLELVPLQKIGDCPIGFYEESNYCVPNNGQRQAAIRQVKGQCPFQFQPSGSYCLAPVAYSNFVIEQTSQDCPRGWVQQQGFCVKECPPLQLMLRDEILRKIGPKMH